MAAGKQPAANQAANGTRLPLDSSTIGRKDGQTLLRLSPLVGIEQHDIGVTEVTVQEGRHILETVLIGNEARPRRDSHKHAVEFHIILEVDELHPLFHLGIMGANVAVLLLHISFYIR